jgi:hypothetical protein
VYILNKICIRTLLKLIDVKYDTKTYHFTTDNKMSTKEKISQFFKSKILEIFRINQRTKKSRKRALYNFCWLYSFIVINSLIIILTFLFIDIFDINITTALYTIGALAIIVSIIGSSLFLPYLQGLKIIFFKRLEFLEHYNLYLNNRLIYENVQMRGITPCSIYFFDSKTEKEFDMETTKISNFEIEHIKEEI